MKRPTDKYNEAPGQTLQGLMVRGGLLALAAIVIATVAGWTTRVRATDETRFPASRLVAREMRSLGEQLGDARGEMALMQVQLERANAVMANSATYQIPADLSAAIYDIALSEGIDPALGYQLVKIESNFKGSARSPMGALGYTQLQLATARFYHPKVATRDLFDRDTNLRLGFRFLNDLLGKYDRDTHTALLAYNRGPAKVSQILAQGGNPANGYSAAVLKGYQPPRTAGEPGWR